MTDVDVTTSKNQLQAHCRWARRDVASTESISFRYFEEKKYHISFLFGYNNYYYYYYYYYWWMRGRAIGYLIRPDDAAANKQWPVIYFFFFGSLFNLIYLFDLFIIIFSGFFFSFVEKKKRKTPNKNYLLIWLFSRFDLIWFFFLLGSGFIVCLFFLVLFCRQPGSVFHSQIRNSASKRRSRRRNRRGNPRRRRRRRRRKCLWQY